MDESCHAQPQTGARCPFYGFSWPAGGGRLIQEGGNRCGLALDRIESCAMEEAGRRADMSTCPVAEGMRHFIRAASPVMVFISTGHPTGLPYSDWWRRTMVQPSIKVAPAQPPSGNYPEIGRGSQSGD